MLDILVRDPRKIIFWIDIIYDCIIFIIILSLLYCKKNISIHLFLLTRTLITLLLCLFSTLFIFTIFYSILFLLMPFTVYLDRLICYILSENNSWNVLTYPRCNRFHFKIKKRYMFNYTLKRFFLYFKVVEIFQIRISYFWRLGMRSTWHLLILIIFMTRFYLVFKK